MLAIHRVKKIPNWAAAPKSISLGLLSRGPKSIIPLDINVNYSEEENPLTLKSDFILSMCELIVGGKDGLQPVEKTIID